MNNKFSNNNNLVFIVKCPLGKEGDIKEEMHDV